MKYEAPSGDTPLGARLSSGPLQPYETPIRLFKPGIPGAQITRAGIPPLTILRRSDRVVPPTSRARRAQGKALGPSRSGSIPLWAVLDGERCGARFHRVPSGAAAE